MPWLLSSRFSILLGSIDSQKLGHPQPEATHTALAYVEEGSGSFNRNDLAPEFVAGPVLFPVVGDCVLGSLVAVVHDFYALVLIDKISEREKCQYQWHYAACGSTTVL